LNAPESPPESPPASIAKSPPAFRAEAVHRLLIGIEGALPLFPLLPVVMALGVWQHVDKVLLLAWLAVTAVLTPGWQYLVLRRYRAEPRSTGRANHWGRVMLWPTLLDGIAWGIGGIVFYSPDALLQQVVVLALIVGIPTASIFATSWWPPIFYVNCYPPILLTAAGLAWRGEPEQLALAFGLAVYVVILHQLMKKAEGVAMETISLRFDKQELIDQLQHEKDVAERANLAKSKFLAAASHDLRQPLHAMTLFVAAMDDRAQPPETRAMLGNIQRCATALESLLQTLLDISKIDAGIIEPRTRDFRLAPLLRRLAAEFALQAQSAGLTLTTRCDDLTAKSDPDLVERILRNLITNAIRYTASGGVEIRCQTGASAIVVEVKDTGIGIPAAQQERVFDEFVQLGNPERDRTKGLGLGLAIVRRLAGLLGTPLTLDSAPGRGSTFRIELPAGNPAAADDGAHDVAVAAPSLEGAVVVVVDDEADVREGMRTLLEGWGCDVIAGEDAESVLHRLDAAELVPHVVLVDYRLRGKTTGVDAIKAVHRHFDLDIPAAIVTGDTAPERLVEAQASGYALLHKPLRPAKLRVLLQNLRRGIEVSA
jgi:two-component system, sensor histidine kinase